MPNRHYLENNLEECHWEIWTTNPKWQSRHGYLKLELNCFGNLQAMCMLIEVIISLWGAFWRIYDFKPQ